MSHNTIIKLDSRREESLDPELICEFCIILTKRIVKYILSLLSQWETQQKSIENGLISLLEHLHRLKELSNNTNTITHIVVDKLSIDVTQSERQYQIDLALNPAAFEKAGPAFLFDLLNIIYRTLSNNRFYNEIQRPESILVKRCKKYATRILTRIKPAMSKLSSNSVIGKYENDIIPTDFIVNLQIRRERKNPSPDHS